MKVWWKRDEYGRPKLKSVKADVNIGDGFAKVIERHGSNAIEMRNILKAYDWANEALKAQEQEAHA